jgi:hypothetical protein
MLWTQLPIVIIAITTLTTINPTVRSYLQIMFVGFNLSDIQWLLAATLTSR